MDTLESDDDTKLCMVMGSHYFNVMFNLEGVTIDANLTHFVNLV